MKTKIYPQTPKARKVTFRLNTEDSPTFPERPDTHPKYKNGLMTTRHLSTKIKPILKLNPNRVVLPPLKHDPIENIFQENAGLGARRKLLIKKNITKVEKYDDDEAINTSDFHTKYNNLDFSSIIDIKLLLSRSHIKLHYNSAQLDSEEACPYFLASIKTMKPKNLPKTPIDLVIAIDCSENLKGDKLKYVKQALESAIYMMDENDRLSIVTYNTTAKRITPLLRMTSENRIITLAEIEKLKAEGGCCTNSGLSCAYDILADRKTKNFLSEVFLLYSGPDSFDSSEYYDEIPKEKKENISLHYFGYGHASDQYCGNSFYYVEDLKTIDQAFLICLGELAGKFANYGEISLIPQPFKCNHLQIPIYLEKPKNQAYDDSEYGKSQSRNVHVLTFEKTWNFGFRFEVKDPDDSFIPTPDRKINILKGVFTFKDFNGKEHVITKDFTPQIFHPNDKVPKATDDPKIVSYYWMSHWNQCLMKNRKFPSSYSNSVRVEVLLKTIQELEKKLLGLPYHDEMKIQGILREMASIRKSLNYKTLDSQNVMIEAIRQSQYYQAYSFQSSFDFSSKIQKLYKGKVKSYSKL